MDKRLYSCPVGEDGIQIIEKMNEHHSDLMNWGLSLVPEISPFEILDIGCGGGMFLKKLSQKYKNSKLFGIDISDDCIRITKEINSELIENYRLTVMKQSVERLPFWDETFGLITAVETYFFWPDLKDNLREVCSKISKDGILLIISEQYPHPDFVEKNKSVEEETGAKLVTNEEMVSILSDFGMKTDVYTIEDKNWVTFVSHKQ